MSRWDWVFRRRKRMMDELDRDIRDFIKRETEDNIDRGLPPEEARYAALRKFGNVTRVREDTRAVWTRVWLEQLWQDVRYGLRMLARNPGFTAVAVLTLTLGIGVNTTLFTAFDAVALKPLPVEEPNSVVRLVRTLASGSEGDFQYAFSYPEYAQYRDHNDVFSGLVAASWPVRVSAMLPGGKSEGSQVFGEPEGVQTQLVSGNYFAVLGIPAALGRTFLADEAGASGGQAVAVLSYSFWQRRFNADRGILGRVLKLNGTPLTVVGIAGRDFIGTANPPRVPDVWTPLAMQPQLIPGESWLSQANDFQLQILGRLSPAIRLEKAQAGITVLAQQFQSAQNRAEQDRTLAITLQHATYFGETNSAQFRAFIALLMLLVGMVLLVACANLANMALARCAGRQREIGVRLAMGVSRGRLVRQWLTESVLLGLLGGAAALLFSLWAAKAMWLGIAPIIQALFNISPAAVQMGLDFRVFTYTFVLSIATGVLFGLSPALQFSRPALTAAIRNEGTAFGPRMTPSRLRNSLVTGEVAVSALLLLTGMLLARGVVRSQTTDPGFETKHVIGPLGLWFSSDPAKSNGMARRVIDRVSELSAVRSVGLVYRAPWSGTWTPPVRVEGTKAQNLPWQVLANYVSPGYFPTLGIPIVSGRNFSRYEGDTGAAVAIVSERAARQFWPGESPVGKMIKLDLNFKGAWADYQVVGVAKDVRTANLSRIDPGYIYVATDAAKRYQYELLIRTEGDDTTTAPVAVRAALEDLDRAQFPPGMWLDTLASGPLRTQKIIPEAITWFAGSLGFLALLLTVVGVYGVVSYAVSASIHEIGVRMALGASKSAILYWTLQQRMRPVILGAVAGLACSIGVSVALRAVLVTPGNPDFLFGASPFDAASFAGAFCLLASVAFVACYVPARRASMIDPMVALRCE